MTRFVLGDRSFVSFDSVARVLQMALFPHSLPSALPRYMPVPWIFASSILEVDGDVPYRPTAEAADAAQVEEDEDDDAIAARRARVRERLKARRAAEAEVLEVEQEEIAK